MSGLDSTSKTPRKALELTGRIGKKRVQLLIDSRLNFKYILGQECPERKIKIAKGRGGKESMIPDG